MLPVIVFLVIYCKNIYVHMYTHICVCMCTEIFYVQHSVINGLRKLLYGLGAYHMWVRGI